MKLPPPRESSDISVEQALARRKTARTYARRAMKLEHLGQLLWAAQGVTHGEGYRKVWVRLRHNNMSAPVQLTCPQSFYQSEFGKRSLS